MINELLFWAAHSSDDAAWRIYAQSRGINCAPRGDHTRRLHTPSRRECSQRTTDHQERGEHTPHRPEREKKDSIFIPQKYLKSLPQTTAIMSVCVCDFCHRLYWDQFFDQSTRTTRIPCPQVANYRPASSRKTHGPRKMVSCDCFSLGVLFFIFLSLSLGRASVCRTRAEGRSHEKKDR